MTGIAKGPATSRMRLNGDRIEITVGSDHPSLTNFKREFGDYAPLIDLKRGEPSLTDLERMVKGALATDGRGLRVVLHVEAVKGDVVRREVRAYSKDGNSTALAVARWSRDDGVSVAAIN